MSEPVSGWEELRAGVVLDAALRLGRRLLNERQVPSRDADVLLQHIVRLNRVGLILEAKRPLSQDEALGFAEALRRRAEGEPVAYILGEREFWSLPFTVDRRVLIPRPETEHVIELALEVSRFSDVDSRHALDIGTGSGILAIVLAHELPAATIVATDVSDDALSVARSNAARHCVQDRLTFRQGDLFEPIDARELFDLIVSNPPYVPTGDAASMMVDVLDYEPKGALFSGSDGLDLVRRLLQEAPRHLAPGGWLVFEFGAGQGWAIARLAVELGGREVLMRRDLAGWPRVVAVRWSTVERISERVGATKVEAEGS